MSLRHQYMIIFWGYGAHAIPWSTYFSNLPSARETAEKILAARSDDYPFGYSIAFFVVDKTRKDPHYRPPSVSHQEVKEIEDELLRKRRRSLL